jgi:hypothetical protein
VLAKYDPSAQHEDFHPKHFDAVLVYRLEIEALTFRHRLPSGATSI